MRRSAPQNRCWRDSPFAGCALLAQITTAALAGQVGPVPQIVYGGDGSFPPYEFLDAQGKPAGLNVDLIRAVANSQGFQVQVRLEPWHKIRNGVLEGSVDVATMYRSHQREQEVEFAIPHEVIYHEMFVRRGSPALRSLAEVAGKRLLVQTDTLSVDALREMGYGAALRLVASEPDALRALMRGDGDVAIVTQTVSRPFLTRSEFAGRITATGPPVLLTEYGFVTRKGHRALIETLNQGVAAVKTSGEYERIVDRWLRPDQSAGRIRKIAWGAGAVLVAALLAFAWAYVLRKRVARQSKEIGQLGTSYRELADYQAEIDRANKELEAFSYSVSHDLRAPLRAIDGYTSILIEDYEPQLDTEGKRVCEVIRDNVQRMGQLIEDLLNFSRLSRAPMACGAVDMHELAASEYRNAGAADVRFELEPLPATVGGSAAVAPGMDEPALECREI